MRQVDFYGKSISESGFEKALDEYWDYMKNEKLEVEFTEEEWENTSFSDVEQNTFSHVIYHAEINGFEIEDYMI